MATRNIEYVTDKSRFYGLMTYVENTVTNEKFQDFYGNCGDKIKIGENEVFRHVNILAFGKISRYMFYPLGLDKIDYTKLTKISVSIVEDKFVVFFTIDGKDIQMENNYVHDRIYNTGTNKEPKEILVKNHNEYFHYVENGIDTVNLVFQQRHFIDDTKCRAKYQREFFGDEKLNENTKNILTIVSIVTIIIIFVLWITKKMTVRKFIFLLPFIAISFYTFYILVIKDKI